MHCAENRDFLKRCNSTSSGEGEQPGDDADQQPGGAATEGHQPLRHLPQEDDGARHPVQPPLLPGGLQEGDCQQKGEAQGRGGQQGHNRRHLLPPEAENMTQGTRLFCNSQIYLNLFIFDAIYKSLGKFGGVLHCFLPK